MRRSRSVLVLIIVAVFGMSFAVPVEDDPETPYDESQSLPYESSPAVSVVEPEAAAPAPVGPPCVLSFRRVCLRRVKAQRLEQRAGPAYPICDSLTIFDHTFRC